MIRVLLVDDQKTVRETLKVSLEPETDIEVVGTANDGITALKQVEIHQPDVVIMNLEMPSLDGADATKQITNKFDRTKVLIHTSCDRDEYITKSLAMGAKGYLIKSLDSADLAIAIRNIDKGYTQISPGLLEKLLVYTDSGIVLNKLQTSSQLRSAVTLPSKTQKTISNLKFAYRQQHEEIAKLRQSLDSARLDLPKINQNIANHNKQIWFTVLVLLTSLSLLGLSVFKLYNKTDNLQLRVNNFPPSVIPTERIGLYGEFSLNGIAQRVSKAFEQDSVLKDVSTVYIAQEDDAIVLTGSVVNADILKRMENIALEVTGVEKVYTSLVEVQPRLTKNTVDLQQLKSN
jgi:DNA-binding NarL/FixJ family response regulator